MSSETRTAPDPASEAEAEVIRLDRELAEIERLIGQARDESRRHESRRAQAEDRVAAMVADTATAGEDLRGAIEGLVTATRKVSLMESQIDVLEGKQRTLARFRDRLQHYADALAALVMVGGTDAAAAAALVEERYEGAAASSVQAIEAQEVLRRDIARAMHDGPAQSLTNIALQTQIVERVLARDPTLAVTEVDELLRMIRQTLEETKTFIFDIRPMVLDDLGLVPTLRRAVRDRGKASQIPIEFDSRGDDRRLGTDLESSLFRVLDDAIVGFIASRPARITMRLGWGDSGLRAEVRSSRHEEVLVEGPTQVEGPTPRPPAPEPDPDLPPALAEMIVERHAAAERDSQAAAGAAAAAAGAAAAAEAAAVASAGSLPAAAWKAIKARVSFGKISVELYDRGRLLVAEVAYPA
jgi:two-component system sensor histidine kinase DegS